MARVLNRKPPFEKILIANRGEIAVRIIHATHQLGARAVAVYSDPDAAALHVLQADEAYRIGPGPASDSYLKIDAILDAAKEAEAEAVHPGYGFLSENADFAQAVVDAGLTFIGPHPEVIRLMGDKVAAKRLMAESGIPLVPGYEGDDQSDEAFRREAEGIGYPVMVKAAAGGGGRGMRTVQSPEALGEALEGARREAISAFGNGRLFLEKLLVEPRHIEVQVLGDAHGNLIHLFERDCSVQRRNQKVVEESPSPALDEGQRAVVCDAGRRAAQAAGYVNAGTVEFLWKDGQFYFLEMNTRIQVEHPVTELVTGRDLVEAQIRIAAGEALAWKQDDIKVSGHAIEARVYAEDAEHGFLPQPGVITRFDLDKFDSSWRQDVRFDGEAPEAGAFADTAIISGSQVSRYYDPMVAKLLVREESRPEAIERMAESLGRAAVGGVTTNLSFLLWVFGTETFAQGKATTGFLDQEWQGLPEPEPLSDNVLTAAVGVVMNSQDVARLGPRVDSPWTTFPSWRLGRQAMPFAVRILRQRDGVVFNVDGYVDELPGGEWLIRIGSTALGPVRYDWLPKTISVRRGKDVHRFEVSVLRRVGDQLRHEIILSQRPDHPEADDSRYSVTISRTQAIRDAGPSSRAGDGVAGETSVTSPMPGAVIKVMVETGDTVQPHQPLLVLEAMKMEHVIESPRTGVVKVVHHQVGDLVGASEALIDIGDE